MDVSIIVVAWNVRQFLYNCLKSVYDQTRGIDFEVIYVDNASEDGSVQMVAKEFPQVKIIENEKNEGFIKANNQGIEIAKGRYVLLLNSDTVVLDNATAKTVKFADEHPETAVVGCKVLNPDRTLQRTCLLYPSALNVFLAATHLYRIFPKSRFFGREHMTWWDYNDVREVQAVCGCFSLARTEAIKQVGLMDEAYYVYGDDPDWCYRFRKHGWKVMFTPHAHIIHYGGQTTGKMKDKFLLQLFGAKLIFMRKHGSPMAFPFACLFIAMFFFLRIPYWCAMAMLGKNKTRAMTAVKTYLKGGTYCLVGWKNLLMNKDAVQDKL
jgi:GT2 family glycosyltransferase